MKFKFVVAVVFMMMIGVSAWADDVKPAEPAVLAALSQMKQYGDDIKITPTDYPNGVFVRIKEWSGERPISASIFAGKLRSAGFKIADKAEDADAVIMVGGSMSFSEIDKGIDGGISAGKADVIIGAVIGAISTNGLNLVGNTDWAALGNSKPSYTNLGVSITNQKKKGFMATGVTGTFKCNASGVKAAAAEFDLDSDQWLKDFVVADGAKNLLPASAVPDGKTLAEPAAK